MFVKKPGFVLPLLLYFLLSACSVSRPVVPTSLPPQPLRPSPSATPETPSLQMTEDPSSTYGQPPLANERIDDPNEHLFNQRIDGITHASGNAGALFMNAMPWSDHETRSI